MNDKSKVDYSNMSLAELSRRNKELMAAKAQIRAEQRKINEAMDAARAREAVAKLPPKERAALAQAIKAVGIESAEEVTGPAV